MFIKDEKIGESKISLNKLKNLDFKKEMINILSTEFESSKNLKEITEKANIFKLNLTMESLGNRDVIYNAKKEIFKLGENLLA